MKIDNRIFIAPAMPFLFLGIMRTLWAVAGADWSEPDFAAFFSFAFGLIVGVPLTLVAFREGWDLGHFHIGRKRG